jgi:hypothetical protein
MQARQGQLEETVDPRFAVGQRWAYRARPGEEGSILTIVRLDKHPSVGTIVHVSLSGLRLVAPDGSAKGDVAHLPFARQALEESVIALVETSSTLPAFQDGYDAWRLAFVAGKGGVFTTHVAEVVAGIAASISGQPAR